MGGNNGGRAEREEPTNQPGGKPGDSGAMMPRENSSKKSESIFLNATGDQVR